ncbi:hypothetical protein KFK09_006828 [Dendrobium nobile]|uniref:Uncharacterized protein n=1 Tax=Dendrobium nobile TaxID=94219 RepID=A0A8T3BQB5_DENNO|nr:hypothetical protein KFK09_006828 [Dendrobium nobile]
MRAGGSASCPCTNQESGRGSRAEVIGMPGVFRINGDGGMGKNREPGKGKSPNAFVSRSKFRPLVLLDFGSIHPKKLCHTASR